MNLSHRRVGPTAAQQAQRRSDWEGAPAISDRFPSAKRFAIELSFSDPTGADAPSQMRLIYEPSMRAHFESRCPIRDCADGGFDLQHSVTAVLSNPRLPKTGSLRCNGSRRGKACDLELKFSLAWLEEKRA